MLLFCLLLFFSVVNLYPLPNDYRSQFLKTYLVNYSAIKSDFFLTKLAHKKFIFLDEAQQKERAFIRSFDKDYLILDYKDLVALNTYLPEFNKINLQEFLFLHSSEPACLTISFDHNWKFNWMHDRRFTPGSVKYRLYWGFDSTNVNSPTDTVVDGTELSISLPKSARYVRLKTVLDDSTEIDYSFVIKLIYQDNIPVFIPLSLNRVAKSNIVYIEYKFKLISKVIPDSVWVYVDFSHDNIFSENEKFVFSYDLDTIFINQFNTNGSETGYEVYLICFKNGKMYRYPKEGSWLGNVNNRCINPTYKFYFMNIVNNMWLENYIEQVMNAFSQGYNGLFVDDACYRIWSGWPDAYPPVDYDENLWFESFFDFFKELRKACGDKMIIYNGLATPSLEALDYADGAMYEGFAYSHWAGYSSFSNWKTACELGLKCQYDYGKMWVPLGGIKDFSPEPRLFVTASYLLVADTNSVFGNATNYQTFAHFPEFDIPTGKPITNATNSIDDLLKLDSFGKSYYSREFEKCIVYVNPNPNDTIILPEIYGKNQIMVDSALTINGGRLYTIKSDSLLLPRSAKIILKTNFEEPILMSPIWQNPIAKIKSINPSQVQFEFSVQAADSSSDLFKSNASLPLYVIADLTKIGVPYDLELKNDGTPANSNFSEFSGQIVLPAGGNLKNLTIPFVVFSTTGLFSVGYAPVEIENVDTTNLVPNFSFEYDVDFDQIPDSWSLYKRKNVSYFEYDTIPSDAQHLNRCIKFVNKTEQDSGGMYVTIYFPKNTILPLKVSGWSKAENVSGVSDNNYSIYVDAYYSDGTPWYARTTRFSPLTHGWEYSEMIYYPEKPLSYATVYCLFRAHSGTAWFDNIYVGLVDTTLNVGNDNNVWNVSIPEILSIETAKEVKIITNWLGTARVKIVDMLNRICWQKAVQLETGLNIIILDEAFEQLASGSYIIQIQIGDERKCKLIIIVK